METSSVAVHRSSVDTQQWETSPAPLISAGLVFFLITYGLIFFAEFLLGDWFTRKYRRHKFVSVVVFATAALITITAFNTIFN